MTYAVYANRKLILTTTNLDEAQVRYVYAKMDDTVNHVAIAKVKTGKSASPELTGGVK